MFPACSSLPDPDQPMHEVYLEAQAAAAADTKNTGQLILAFVCHEGVFSASLVPTTLLQVDIVIGSTCSSSSSCWHQHTS